MNDVMMFDGKAFMKANSRHRAIAQHKLFYHKELKTLFGTNQNSNYISVAPIYKELGYGQAVHFQDKQITTIESNGRVTVKDYEQNIIQVYTTEVPIPYAIFNAKSFILIAARNERLEQQTFSLI